MQSVKLEDVVTEKSNVSPIYECELCEAKMTGPDNYKMHMNGTKHRKNVTRQQSGEKPIKMKRKIAEEVTAQITESLKEVKDTLWGLNHVTEYILENSSQEPRYVCHLCNSKCDARTLVPHLLGRQHKQAYLKEYHSHELSQVATSSSEKAGDIIPLLEQIYLKLPLPTVEQQKIKVLIQANPFASMLAHEETIAKKSKLSGAGHGDTEKLSTTELLQALINSEITNESEAGLALVVSNALTNALLSYRTGNGGSLGKHCSATEKLQVLSSSGRGTSGHRGRSASRGRAMGRGSSSRGRGMNPPRGGKPIPRYPYTKDNKGRSMSRGQGMRGPRGGSRGSMNSGSSRGAYNNSYSSNSRTAMANSTILSPVQPLYNDNQCAATGYTSYDSTSNYNAGYFGQTNSGYANESDISFPSNQNYYQSYGNMY